MRTVGLVHLSGFKNHRMELAEQRDREAAEKSQPIRSSGSGGGGPTISFRDGSEAPTSSRGKRTKKPRKVVKGNCHLRGRMMAMMALVMAVTLHYRPDMV